MSISYLNRHPSSSVSAGGGIVRIGQKRPINNIDNFDAEYPTKRGSANLYAQTYWSENPEASPKTPESGIDMNDLGCSPPRYSVTRTAAHGLFDCSPSADVQMMSVSELEHELQPAQFKDGFYLKIVDEPEENYRARYDSEGCRGPMKGRNGGCPTVELISKQHQWSNASIKVQLVAADNSLLNSCKLDSTDDGANLLKKVHHRERVSFENLRIRRLKKGDTTGRCAANSKQQTKQILKGARSKQDEKVAHLLFTATIRTMFNEEVVLKALSQPIYLNASHDPPEIHCIVPQYATNGDSVAIVGTRMHSPRVSFVVCVDGNEQEIPADINKEVSHQNALVIKVPLLPMSSYQSNMANVQICVTAGKGDRTGKEPLRSNPVPFCCILSGVCKECVMNSQYQQPQQQHYMYRQLNHPNPTSSPPPTKGSIMNPSRQTMTPSKSSSPRPHHSQSPGYSSPPPPNGGGIPVTQCSTSYLTFNQSVSPPPSHITANSQQQQPPSDVVDDLLLNFCNPSNPVDHCTVATPSCSPQTSPRCFNSVVEPMIDRIGFSDSHSGPVSPDEFNRYLPSNNQVMGNAFGPTTSCHLQRQDYTNVYSNSTIGMVQPNSLGQFSQNP